MRTLGLTSVLLLFLLRQSLALPNPVQGEESPDRATTVYYINGVDNDFFDAWDSRDALETKLRDHIFEIGDPALSERLSVKLAYNRTGGLFKDLLQAAGQVLQGEVSRFWRFWARLEPAPDWFQALAKNLIQSIDLNEYVDDEDLRGHVNEYDAELSESRTVVAVAHSQGNLYANRAFSFLFDTLRLPGRDRFKVVAVATPASFVAGGGKHTTLEEDNIADLVFLAVNPLRLEPNITNDRFCLVPWDCHSFVNSYLKGSGSRSKILGEIIAASSQRQLSPTLIFDGSGDHRFFNAALSDLAIDSKGRLIALSTHFSSGCGFNICGVRLNSILPNGILNWETPSTGGFISLRGGPLLIGPNDRIYVGGFGPALFSFSSNGNPIPGWPVTIAPPGQVNVSFFQGNPVIIGDDGVVYAGAGVFFSFSGHPSAVVALNPDGSEKWRRDFPGGGSNSQIVQGLNGDIYLNQSFSRLMRLAHSDGSAICERVAQFFGGFAAGSDGLFTTHSPHSFILSFDSNCNARTIFNSSGHEIKLQRYDQGRLFAIAIPVSPFSPGQTRLIALSREGTSLWRNEQIFTNPFGRGPIEAIANNTLYVLGQDTNDGHKTKLFLVDSGSGQIINSVETTGLCDNCGVVVSPSGTIYLNDRNSTKIYRLN